MVEIRTAAFISILKSIENVLLESKTLTDVLVKICGFSNASVCRPTSRKTIGQKDDAVCWDWFQGLLVTCGVTA